MIDSVLPQSQTSQKLTNNSKTKGTKHQLEIEGQETTSRGNVTISHSGTSSCLLNINSKNIFKQDSLSNDRYCHILKTFEVVKPFISGNEKSFNEIQNFLKIETEQQFNLLVNHLETLKQMCKLQSREAVFIVMRDVVINTLQEKKENFWPEGGYSAILDFIFTSFYHKNFEKMSLQEIKEKVIGQFNFDIKMQSFDEEFVQYLQQSQYFLISRKEVYFI